MVWGGARDRKAVRVGDRHGVVARVGRLRVGDGVLVGGGAGDVGAVKLPVIRKGRRAAADADVEDGAAAKRDRLAGRRVGHDH